MIQFGGDTRQEAKERAEGEHARRHVAYLEDLAEEDNLWSVRELGLGATAYPPGNHETHEGWEDAAAPRARQPGYADGSRSGSNLVGSGSSRTVPSSLRVRCHARASAVSLTASWNTVPKNVAAAPLSVA